MTETYVIVTVEVDEEPVRFRRWRGPSVRAIKRAARTKYGPKAVLQFGRAIYLNHYGAH